LAEDQANIQIYEQGRLLDSAGRLIGMNTAIVSPSGFSDSISTRIGVGDNDATDLPNMQRSHGDLYRAGVSSPIIDRLRLIATAGCRGRCRPAARSNDSIAERKCGGQRRPEFGDPFGKRA
jgi:hypothetical protein